MKFQNIQQKSFKIIAIFLPLLLLAMLEIVLRIFHVGYSSRLFIQDKNNDSLVHNNLQISRLFFNSWDAAPNAYVQYFERMKPENTFRIFVLGESSALGFPYNHRGSFPLMLQYMLDKTYTEKEVEIINLAVTAVNSYALLAFAGEIIKMQPDAILIYTGHNEYYGALGAGSLQKFGFNRGFAKLIIQAKKLRIVQIAFELTGKLRNLFTQESSRNDSGLMIKMAGNQEIDYNGSTYKKGLQQFENNMREVLQVFNAHQLPVYFSDLVSNARGQKPFISKPGMTTDSAMLMKFFRQGYSAFDNDSLDTAYEFLIAADKIDSTFSLNNFILGEILYEKGNFTDASRYFNKAREFDLLRFRAPEDINRIIRRLSDQFANVYFVESREMFLQAAPNRILGNELFTDHLHPNLDGNFLLAKSFYNALISYEAIGKTREDINPDSFRIEIPVTILDSLSGSWLIQHMKQKWPFFDSIRKFEVGVSYPEQLAFRLFNKRITWDMAVDSLYRFYLSNNRIDEAVKVAKAYLLEHPFEYRTAGEIGRLYQQDDNFPEAYFYFKKAFDKSHNIDYARQIVIVLLKMDKPEECRHYLKIIRNQAPGDKTSANLSRMIDNVIKAKNIIQKQPGNEDSNSDSDEILARYYLYIGNLKMAKIYLNKLPEMGPDHPIMRDYYKKSKETEKVDVL